MQISEGQTVVNYGHVQEVQVRKLFAHCKRVPEGIMINPIINPMINPITGRSSYGEAMPSFHPDSVGLLMI